MPSERFVALGLAGARSAWFTEVARWSTVGSVPVEFVKCISAEEVRARLTSGRPFSAVLVDAGTGAIDRDLVDLARARDVAVIVVDDGRGRQDWAMIGVSGVLHSPFERGELLEALESNARRIGAATSLPIDAATPAPVSAIGRGRLVSVTGPGGTGSSTVAVALTQGLADDDQLAGRVVLADLKLQAELAMLHDARDIVPGVQELVEAFRGGRPSPEEVRALTFDVVNRRYRLLLGLRRHRDWAALRPRSFEAAVEGLRRTFAVVVADVDGDLEGEPECGAVEVEERNVMARTVSTRANVVVAVGSPGMKGLHSLVRTVNEHRDHDIRPNQILAVVNQAPRSSRARAEYTRALALLTGATAAGSPSVVGPLFLPERRGLDELHRDGARLPSNLTTPLARAVRSVLDRVPAGQPPPPFAQPVPVAPGSLGSWAEQGVEGR
jgi:MinD-like ATPase involved in chromosome partitioning or flagellar assembly